jgi:predicted metal-dependent phosphoesterase TrpH
VLKVELHAHTSLDPCDYIPHTTRQLIDRAAELGYGALAITLHDRYYDPSGDEAYARARNVVLIRGIERTIERRHMLLLNFPADCEAVRTFEDLRALRRRHPQGLVVAPHAFYPTGTAMSADADRHADLVDAIEVNSMFISWLDFNTRAVAWARANGKPVVGNTDLHLLEQLGRTYTLVDAEPTADAICAAIRAGRVEVRSEALSAVRAAWVFGRMLLYGLVGRVRARWRGA